MANGSTAAPHHPEWMAEGGEEGRGKGISHWGDQASELRRATATPGRRVYACWWRVGLEQCGDAAGMAAAAREVQRAHSGGKGL